ncbi:endonuclease-8 [Naumannella cuiyingiana]|uniref:DNA-(apurinic or apyrimidinic site) lyase n=1 Tax=Naumannella cuiyingiana TaxID=1347891 RepID=A0A7Z0D8B4_9ACTN|nr:Fpg/Nei family DNA glycosylase [Naumannella cuiyingiana]NYI70796.1 endonuclease-8 [Naumannella cuiyingiana]
MPEGDTVHRAAAELDAALTGRVLTRAELRVPRYAATDLTGATVERTRAHGKHLFLDLLTHGRALTLHSHLKMEGAWHVYRPGGRWRRPPHTARVVLATATAQAIGFDLGLVRLDAPERIAASVADLGPDPLRPDWDADEAIRRLAADPDRTIGEALLDQRRIAGLGNVYRCELCFLRGLHPSAPVGEVELAPLVALAYRTINDNVVRRVRVFTGVDRPGQDLWVHGRENRPCRRCGTPIRRGRLGGGEGLERVLWWCPRCQPPGRATMGAGGTR